MASNIDEIMDMLDWHKPKAVQRKGRKLAKDVKCFQVFLHPGYPQYNKNVWDNCALIIADKTDVELRPYLRELFEWLEDMNWPGAFCIWERLERYEDKEWLNSILNDCIYKARVLKQEMWLDNLRKFQGQDVLQQSTSGTVNEIFARRMYKSLVEENTHLDRVLFETTRIHELMSETERNKIELYRSFSEDEKNVFMDAIKRTRIDTIYSLFRVLDGYGKEYDRQQFEIKLQINEIATEDGLANAFYKIILEMNLDEKGQ